MAWPIGVRLPRDPLLDFVLDFVPDLLALDLRDEDALFDAPRPREVLDVLLREPEPPFAPRDDADVPDRPRFCALFFDDVLRVRVAFMTCLFDWESFDGAPRAFGSGTTTQSPCLARAARNARRLLRTRTSGATVQRSVRAQRHA
jgi:hypothetical protein